MKIQKTYRRVSKSNRTGVRNVKEIYRMYSEIERIERDLQKMKRKLRLYSQGSGMPGTDEIIAGLLEDVKSLSRRSRMFSDEGVSDQKLSESEVIKKAAKELDGEYGDHETGKITEEQKRRALQEIEKYQKMVYEGNKVTTEDEDPYEDGKYEVKLVGSLDTVENNTNKRSRLYRRIFSENEGLYITVDVSPNTLQNLYNIYESESEKKSVLMKRLSNIFGLISIGASVSFLVAIIAKLLKLMAISLFIASKGWIIAIIGILAVLLSAVLYMRSRALEKVRVSFKDSVEHLSALMSIMEELNIEDADIKDYLKTQITKIGFDLVKGRFFSVSQQTDQLLLELYKKLSTKYNIKRVYLKVGKSVRLVYAQVQK